MPDDALRIHPSAQPRCLPAPSRSARSGAERFCCCTCSWSLSRSIPRRLSPRTPTLSSATSSIPPGSRHFEWVNPNAPKGGDLELVPPLRITNFDKYNPFTLKGTAPPGLSSLRFRDAAHRHVRRADDLLRPARRRRPGRAGPPLRDIPHQPRRALPRRQTRHGSGREAQLRHAHEQAGGASVSRGLRRREPRGRRRRRYGALRVQESRAPSCRCSSARHSGIQPRVGRRQAFRPGGHGHADRNGPLPRRPRELRPRHHLPARSRTTGRAISTCAAACTTSIASPTRSTRTIPRRPKRSRPASSTTSRCSRPATGRASYIGKKFDVGRAHQGASSTPSNAGDFQGYLINTRREQVQGPARARGAGACVRLRMDEPAVHVQLVHARAGLLQRQRLRGEGAARAGRARAARAAAREAAARKSSPSQCRCRRRRIRRAACASNLRKARDLLAEAGWTYRDGALRNAKGEPFVLEYLDSGGGERIATPYFQALAKLGIEGEYRGPISRSSRSGWTCSISISSPCASRAPSRREASCSTASARKSADTEGSSNLIGVRDPAVDALVNQAVAATTRPAAHREPACARPRAAARALRRAAVVREHLSRRLPLRQVRAAASRARCTIGPRTGSSRRGGSKEIARAKERRRRCGPTYSSACC